MIKLLFMWLLLTLNLVVYSQQESLKIDSLIDFSSVDEISLEYVFEIPTIYNYSSVIYRGIHIECYSQINRGDDYILDFMVIEVLNRELEDYMITHLLSGLRDILNTPVQYDFRTRKFMVVNEGPAIFNSMYLNINELIVSWFMVQITIMRDDN